MLIFVVIGLLIVLDFMVFLITANKSSNFDLAMFYLLRLLLTSVFLMFFGLIIEDFRKKKLKEPIKYEEVTETFYRKIE